MFAAVSHLPHLLAFALVHEIAGARRTRRSCSATRPAGSATSRASPEPPGDVARHLRRQPRRAARRARRLRRTSSTASRAAARERRRARRSSGCSPRRARRASAGWTRPAATERMSRGLSRSRRRSRARRGHGAAAGLEEHLQPHAAARRAGARARPRSATCSNPTTRACMLEALRDARRARRRRRRRGACAVHGAGGAFPVKTAELFLGNAGTAFRPLTAVLALCGGEYRLSGVPRMHERPIGDLVDALRGSARASTTSAATGYPPLAIHPGARSRRAAPSACAATCRASS